MKIHYEPHPVSPERKAELRARGLTILDSRFAPRTAVSITAEAASPAPKRRGRKPKVADEGANP